jgi:hypothetical protein
MKYKLMIGATALIAVGCGNSSKQDAYVPQPKPEVPVAEVNTAASEELFPLQVGNQWTYSVTINRIQGGQQLDPVQDEMTWKVTKVTPIEGGTKATIELTTGGKTSETQTWVVNKKGIYQVTAGINQKPFSTPQPVALFPATEGTNFDWAGTGTVPISKDGGKITSSSKTLAPQEVDTGVGSISAIPIETSSKFQAGKITAESASTLWLAPGTGIVRYRQETVSRESKSGIVTLMRLKAKSLR